MKSVMKNTRIGYNAMLIIIAKKLSSRHTKSPLQKKAGKSVIIEVMSVIAKKVIRELIVTKAQDFLLLRFLYL